MENPLGKPIEPERALDEAQDGDDEASENDNSIHVYTVSSGSNNGINEQNHQSPNQQAALAKEVIELSSDSEYKAPVEFSEDESVHFSEDETEEAVQSMSGKPLRNYGLLQEQHPAVLARLSQASRCAPVEMIEIHTINEPIPADFEWLVDSASVRIPVDDDNYLHATVRGTPFWFIGSDDFVDWCVLLVWTAACDEQCELVVQCWCCLPLATREERSDLAVGLHGDQACSVVTNSTAASAVSQSLLGQSHGSRHEAQQNIHSGNGATFGEWLNNDDSPGMDRAAKATIGEPQTCFQVGDFVFVRPGSHPANVINTPPRYAGATQPGYIWVCYTTSGSTELVELSKVVPVKSGDNQDESGHRRSARQPSLDRVYGAPTLFATKRASQMRNTASAEFEFLDPRRPSVSTRKRPAYKARMPGCSDDSKRRERKLRKASKNLSENARYAQRLTACADDDLLAYRQNYLGDDDLSSSGSTIQSAYSLAEHHAFYHRHRADMHAVQRKLLPGETWQSYEQVHLDESFLAHLVKLPDKESTRCQKAMEAIVSVLRYMRHFFIPPEDLLRIFKEVRREKFGLQSIAQALLNHLDSSAHIAKSGRGGTRCQLAIQGPSALPKSSFTCLMLGTGK